MQHASLILVGSGIKFISHLTTEAKIYIEQSDKVLYLVNEPAMKEWIQKSNPNSESLDSLYIKHPLRKDSYQAITEYILEILRTNQHICVVLYGHPTVFAQPGLEAIRRAKEEGYYAKILPGISAEDCLFADLLINPGSCGCQSFEATDFLVHKRKFDPSCHLIFWQAGLIGELGYSKDYNNKKGTEILCHYLNNFYPITHEVIIYEAAQYPNLEPRITKISLAKLAETTIPQIATLYIPPAYKIPCDIEVLEELGINLVDQG
jgi:uncharacterized protein YabN with tetrapyrrole methylase and pyrophosphatase domain